ncbi:flavoprotein [Pseudonocardia saturnea]|uniref:Flavoprotein n=1 Tax=Pseudonocardia saturnea TaxID=33909 RepID=A0ABQ0RVX5_9PSEU|nr:flavoprotein [Pseudonocardia autotrophica]GEC24822.1 flavoprotein [Pseudonocardia saturnea]
MVGLVGCAAGGVETACESFVRPARARGWGVAVTLTPTAGSWLAGSDELATLQDAAGLPVRVHPRAPGERSPHPPLDCCVVAPASANSVAKLALGIGDNQALTMLCELLGNPAIPLVVFPRVNAAHTRHPAWPGHLAVLRAAGVRLIEGPGVWDLHEPGQAPSNRPLPWDTILAATEYALDGRP